MVSATGNIMFAVLSDCITLPLTRLSILRPLPPGGSSSAVTTHGPLKAGDTPVVRVLTCFGGPLARLEVNIAFETFLRRVENPRLVVDPPPYRPSQIFRGPIHCLIDVDEIVD